MLLWSSWAKKARRRADTMDIIDEYEVCLDVAEVVKGSREMSWAEFCTYKNELRKFVMSLPREI